MSTIHTSLLSLYKKHRAGVFIIRFCNNNGICDTMNMTRNNAFKTSLLFLGIILAAIILRTYILEPSLFKSSEDPSTICEEGTEVCNLNREIL